MSTREDRTRVVIFTRQHRIRGEIALAAGARLTDYIVDASQFIAVVEAEVTDHHGRAVLNAGFLNVNRDSVEIIVPAEEISLMP